MAKRKDDNTIIFKFREITLMNKILASKLLSPKTFSKNRRKFLSAMPNATP